MTLVVDTSILIDHLRGRAEAHRVLRDAVERGEPLAASVLTKVEVLAGMRPNEERATRVLLSSIAWLAVDDELAERAGALANRFNPSHPGVDPVDYVIAATVQRFEAIFLTRNIKHFPMFPHLRSPY